MSYSKSYLASLFNILCFMSLVYLTISTFCGYVLAIYFVYMSSLVAIGGPIGIAIGNRKNAK